MKNYFIPFFLLILILGFTGCGVIMPAVENSYTIELQLAPFSIFDDIDIEKQQDELSQRWDEYWKKLGKFKAENPAIAEGHLAKMKYCIVTLGMTEKEVLFMALPFQIIPGNDANQKIFFYSKSWGPDTGLDAWVTFTDGVVSNIRKEKKSYAW